MRQSLLTEFYILLGLAALGVGMTLLGMGTGWVLALFFIAYSSRHVYNLIRLARVIQRQHRLAPPFPRGLWGEVYRSIARYQQRSRKSRKRQIRFTRRFREAANAVPDALVILDKQHRIDWANPAAARLMNVRWPDDDGRSINEILTNPDLDDFIDAGEYTRPLELAPEHDRTMMLSLGITPFGERKKQRLIVGRDITKVYHLNMIRRDFVANASHELRTPLTVIAGFLEPLIEAPNTPATHRRPLTLMRNQTERMCSIIEDLLTLSRLDMSDNAEEQHLVEVPDELHLIMQEARELSNDQHKFETKIDDTLLLLGHQPELRSAFTNLLFNAIKHTPPGTRISVRWTENDDGVYFTVADDGPGISAEHLPRLTERFYRVDHARSRESGGTGLGLAIVKHVLNRHDGRLTISSQLGSGSVFSCRFPVARAMVRRDDGFSVENPEPETRPYLTVVSNQARSR